MARVPTFIFALLLATLSGPAVETPVRRAEAVRSPRTHRTALDQGPAEPTPQPRPREADLSVDELFNGRPVERVTMEEVIEMALKNNLEVQYERSGINIQRAQIKQAEGAFDPVFAATLQYQQVRRAQDLSNPSSTSEINAQQNSLLVENQNALNLNSQLVAAQGGLVAQTNSALSLLVQAQENVNQLRALQGLPAINVLNVGNIPNVQLLQQQALLEPTINDIVVLNQRNVQAALQLQGRNEYGTRYSLQLTENEFRDTFTGDLNPVHTLYETFLGITIQQPLLRGFGRDANLLDVRTSKLNARVQALNWKQNVSSTIQGVMAAYYDMLFAIDDIRVRQSAIDADTKLVDLYRRRVDLGFGSPFDISQAQVAVSTDREALLLSKNTFLERQFALKRLVTANFNLEDPRLFLPVSLPNLTPPVINRTDLLRTAFENRYDYRATLANAELRDLQLRFAKNQLLPQLDLVGSFGLNGLDRGLDTSVGNSLSAGTPQYSFGFQFQIPIGNRQARGQYEAVQGQKAQALIRIKQSELAVGVDVDTVLSRIETNRQRVEAARKTRELGEEAVRIAYRRLEEGQISAYDITEQQRKTYDARSREFAALAELNKSVTLLWQVTGTVLQREGIGFREPTDTYTPPPKSVPR